MPKYIEIQCSEKVKDIICMSLRKFAYLAYPKAHNSECNLVASDALLNAADLFEDKHNEAGIGLLNRRLRMMIKTAIEAHYDIVNELEGRQTQNECALMLRVCKGEVVSDEVFEAAKKQDCILSNN